MAAAVAIRIYARCTRAWSWVVEWQSATMPAPVRWYYQDEAAAVQEARLLDILYRGMV